MTSRHVLVALSFLRSASGAFAQDIPPKVSAMIGVSMMSGGPGDEIGESLQPLGFVDPTDGRAPDGGSYLGFVAHVHVRFMGRHTVGFLAGGAEGFMNAKRDAPVPGQPGREELVRADYRMDSYGLVYSYWLTHYLRLGAGPALHSTDVAFGPSNNATQFGRDRSLGVIADAGLNIPIRQWPGAGLELTVRRNHVPSRDLSPEMRVSFSHWVVGLTIGARF